MVTKKQKKYKVFYFVGGDEFGVGEKRRCMIVFAASEYEAEFIFKNQSDYHYNARFGWVEEA